MKKKTINHIRTTLLLFFSGYLLLGCISFVDTKEVGVVYRFGVWNRTLQAGVHFTLPYPIENTEHLPIINTRNIAVQKPRLLTGDANLVDTHLVVQYDIIEAKSYVLSHADTDSMIASLLQSTLIRVVGHSAVDQETFVNRNLLEEQLRTIAQNDINQLELGISLRSVGFQELSAPKAVIDAFNEISSARGEKETMILSAQSYASKAIPAARGASQELIEAAHAYSTNTHNTAKIRIDRFEQLLDIWNTNPKMLRATMVSQTWRRIKNNVTVHNVDDGEHLILPSMRDSTHE